MPTAGATVEERILDDIVSSLDSIAAGSAWNFTYREVRRQHRDIESVKGQLPALIVNHMGTQQEDDRLGMVRCVLTVDVVGGVRARDDDWEGDLSLVVADICNKLREDWTRGGDAVTTRITNTEIFDSTESGTGQVCACQVTAEVVYRHLYADATSAI